MTGFRLSARLELSRLRPTPQRLRRIIAAFAEWGYEEVYLDWSDSFPWTLDERFHSPDAYDEQLVAGLLKEASAHGIVLNSVFPAPDTLGFVARVPAYRRLFRSESDHRTLQLPSPSVRKFYADLIDDFTDLLPNAGTVLIDYRPSVIRPEILAQSLHAFRERGRRIAAFYDGPVERLSRDLPVLLEGFDLAVVPFSEKKSLADEFPGRLIFTPSNATSADDCAAIKSATDGDSEEGLPLLLRFERVADLRPAAGIILGRSIEGFLAEFRVAAERLVGRPGGARSEAIESGLRREAHALDRRLQDLVDEGWRCVRASREALHDASASDHVKEYLDGAAFAYRESLRISQELRPLLTEIVDPPRLQQALASVFNALYEEYLSLCGRAGLRGAADAPDLQPDRPAP